MRVRFFLWPSFLALTLSLFFRSLGTRRLLE